MLPAQRLGFEGLHLQRLLELEFGFVGPPHFAAHPCQRDARGREKFVLLHRLLGRS